MKYFISFCGLLGLGLLFSWSEGPDRLPVVASETYVHDVMKSLEYPARADVMIRPVNGASIELGARLVLEGFGKKGGQQSAHFKCTSCHNVVREDPILTTSNPETRLAYAEQNDLPFLPGTTLWGVVNRESYYNGDYEKKYGDLVLNARKDLRSAIQLCATECAQGEALSEVEMESVLAYLHTIGLKLSDLPKTAPTEASINLAIDRGSEAERMAVAKELKSFYSLASPATFVLPPRDRISGYELTDTPDLMEGMALYDRACLHCHENQRYSFFELGKTKRDRKFLTKHFPQYTRYSTYQVSRYGTSPIPGKRAYMPHYTAERMSNRQVESLRTYLER